MNTIREGRWDCTYCSATGILGRHDSCPDCSASRPAGTQFYLPQDAPVVTNISQLQDANAGPDWACNFCSSSNRASKTHCTRCGHAREGDSQTQQVRNYGLGQVPGYGDNYTAPQLSRGGMTSQEATSPSRSTWQQSYRPSYQPSSNVSSFDWQNNWPWILGTVCTLLTALLIWGIFHTRSVELTVTGVSWERTIPVEVYTTLTEEGWNIPAGGRQKSARQEIRTYVQVLDHYETKSRQVSEQVQTGTETYVCGAQDLGNGYFKDVNCYRPVYSTQYRTETYQEPVYRQEPVYDTKYTYEIERWVHARTQRASGSSHEVYWPEYSLAQNERVGIETESYTIHFVDEEGKVYSKAFSYNEWLSFERGAQYQAEVNTFGQIREILIE